MEPPRHGEWKRIVREWFAGPNLPYLCLLVVCALSLVSRIILLWR